MRGVRPWGRRHARLPAAIAAILAIALSGAPSASAATTITTKTPPPDILGAPTLVAHTRDGGVGYREIGRGTAFVLVAGQSATMDSWPPRFAHSIPLAHLALFPDAGHAFLFQDAPQFITLVERFVS